MNKDALLATLIGFGIGLLITGIILVSPNLFKNFPSVNLSFLSGLFQKTPTQNLALTPTPTIESPKTLTIESPIAEEIERKDTLLVSGSAPIDSQVIIESSIDEEIVITQKNGKFVGTVTLSEGRNDISVTNYANKTVETKILTVYYTPEDF